MSKLKIAILSYRSAPFGGGQGIYIHDISKALAIMGHEVEVISGPPYPNLSENVSLTKLPGLDLFQTFSFKKRLNIFLNKKNKKFIDFYEFISTLFGGFPEMKTFGERANNYLKVNSGFDVVIDNQSLSYGLIAIEKRFPLIEIIHHPITKDYQYELKSSDKFLYRLSRHRWYSFLKMQKRVAPKLNKIITPSYNSKKDIVNDFKVADKNISVINNGLDTTIFRLIEKDIFKNNYQLITTASADVPLKGLDYTLYALSSLKKTYPEILLNIIGKLKKNGHTERLIEKLDIKNNIRFHSGISKEEIVQLYSKSSIAIVSSLYEGFGIPPLEAMAVGCPVICSNTSSLPEVVGAAAEMFDPLDEEAMKVAMESVLDSESRRNDLVAAGRDRHLMFTWEKCARETEAIYRNLV